MKPEALLAVKVSNYLQIQYPKTIFRFDLASDQRLSIQQAARNSRLHGIWSKGTPDLVIYAKKGNYGALFIELKADGCSPFKKDGTLKKNSHTETQDKFHKNLRDQGYKCEFAVGFDETKKLIDEYLKGLK